MTTQPTRHRWRVTAQGYITVAVVAFVVLSSFVQRINLMVLLAAFLLCPIIIGALVGRRNLVHLQVRRFLPAECHADSDAKIRIEVCNPRRLFPAWGVSVDDLLLTPDGQQLAATAAETLGCSRAEASAIRAAAFFHDLGRVAVPNGVWDKPGALSAGEWERVRLHPYYTERILERCEVLAPLAPIAGSHHERLDGSGYHRGAAGGRLDAGARLLAVDDSAYFSRPGPRLVDGLEILSLIFQPQFVPRSVSSHALKRVIV